jgi:hypothetical protein
MGLRLVEKSVDLVYRYSRVMLVKLSKLLEISFAIASLMVMSLNWSRKKFIKSMRIHIIDTWKLYSKMSTSMFSENI